MSRKLFRINPTTMELEELYDSEKRSVHAVHCDEIPPTEHPATGEIFTSRKKFDEATFRSGCVPVAGCDKPRKRSIYLESRSDALSNALEKAYFDLRDNRIPRPSEHPQVRQMWDRLNRGDK